MKSRYEIVYHTLFYLLCVVFCLNLSACGFKLRGSSVLPPQLKVLYLESEDPYGNLETILRSSLQTAGIELVESKDQAPLVLHVLKPILTTSAGTIGTSSQTRVYNVNYNVTMKLENPQGASLVSPMVFSASRSLVLSANQLITSNNQLSQLEQEMYRDIVSQMYNRLSSVQVREALQKAGIR